MLHNGFFLDIWHLPTSCNCRPYTIVNAGLYSLLLLCYITLEWPLDDDNILSRMPCFFTRWDITETIKTSLYTCILSGWHHFIDLWIKTLPIGAVFHFQCVEVCNWGGGGGGWSIICFYFLGCSCQNVKQICNTFQVHLTRILSFHVFNMAELFLKHKHPFQFTYQMTWVKYREM